MQALLPEEYPAFLASLQEPAPVSIRLNPGKIGGGADRLFPGATPVPWHPEGYYLPERPVFTLDPLFHAGAYYVQEASSMFLQEALRQTLPVSRPLNILDLCAAPGGKSTLLASLMPEGSLLMANEVIRQRAGILRENLEKWGNAHVAVSNTEADSFGALEGWFDLIVTDAPCSGEGLFRKDPDAVREWSPAHVEFCAARQKRILSDVLPALAPGGILVYSTCTYNPQEDEENAAWLARTFDLTALTLSIPREWGIAEASPGHHFYPHRLRGEGFYLALFRKKDGEQRKSQPPTVFRSLKPLPKALQPLLHDWFEQPGDFRFMQTPSGDVLALPAVLESVYLTLDKTLSAHKWFGLYAGSFKGNDFIPSHALALSTALAPTPPHVDLSREEALRYLKKEVFDLPAGAPSKGWVLARHQGLHLGWLKALPNRWNNYLPPERRIRMDLKI